MKVKELYSQVAQLGFEDSLEYIGNFYQSLNRALYQVGLVRPDIRTGEINHFPIANIIDDADDTYSPMLLKSAYTVTGTDAMAYTFQSDGNGTAYIEMCNPETNSWDTVTTLTLASTSGTFVRYYGLIRPDNEFVSGLFRIRFTVTIPYFVKCLALYDTVFSATDTTKIPEYRQYCKYDLSDIFSDYLSLYEPPIRVGRTDARMNQGYDMENDKVLCIPTRDRGVFRISYRHKPTAITSTLSPSTDETTIDLSEELCTLLPLLVGFYQWMDDEPQKAQYYMNLYESRKAEILSSEKSYQPVKITNRNRW